MKCLQLVLVVLLLPGFLLVLANLPEDLLPADVQVDRVVVNKSRHLVTLYSKGEPLRSYRTAVGRRPVGPKVCQGDKRTPEGSYRIVSRNPQSAFHRALRISYPNTRDRVQARLAGCNPGGDIMLHGLPDGLGWIGHLHHLIDWTSGCIAVTNVEIEELWRVVPVGTPIEIRP